MSLKKRTIITNIDTTPIACAKRLRRVRNMANLSRKQICENSPLNFCTYKGWEVGSYGGLSAKGAEQVVKRVAQEGVICSTEWLLYEIGQGPYVIPDFEKIKLDQTKVTPDNAFMLLEKEKILQEILLFRTHFSEAIDYQIKDDGVIPIYYPNDFVAGIKYVGKRINLLVNRYCIIQTLDGKILVRFLKVGSVPNKFMLLCTNPQSSVANPTLYDVELASAAPILRCYRQTEFGK